MPNVLAFSKSENKSTNTLATVNLTSSGLFVPLVAGVTSVTSGSSSGLQWLLVQDKVHVCGLVTMVPSAQISGWYKATLTVPVTPPVLALGYQAAVGVLNGQDENGLQCAGYIAGNGDQKVQVYWKFLGSTPGVGVNHLLYVNFTYTLIPGS